jgi:single-strand DNA-binding protein
MSSLNHVVLIGRLTRDPELRHTATGTAVTNFTVAVDRRPKPDGTKEADFVRVVVWSKVAESCAAYLSKGKLIAVAGRLQVRNYQDQSGQNRTSTEVVAESVQFLSPKGGGGNGNGNGPGDYQAGDASVDAEVPDGICEWPDENPPF